MNNSDDKEIKLQPDSKPAMTVRARTLFRAAVLIGLALLIIIITRTIMLGKEVPGPKIDPVGLVTVDQEAAAQNLAAALRFRTVTTQRPEDTDWTQFTAFQIWLRETYPAFFAAVSSDTVGTHGMMLSWAGSDASRDPLVFMAHQDVVPALEGKSGGWTYPPFDGTRAGGFIYGRGALDDKGSLIAILEAAEMLASEGFIPARTLIFIFGHDEEVAGNGAQKAAELLKSRGIAPYAVVDEGGAVAENMGGIPGEAALIGVAEKGYMTLILTAEATGGHSSRPPGTTAIGQLAKAIAKIEASPLESGLDDVSRKMLLASAPRMRFRDRMIMANLWLFGPVVEAQLRKDPAMRAMLGTTIAPTIIEGGFKENALPRTATAHVNFRLHNRDSSQSVIKHVSDVINDPSIKIEVSSGFASEPSPISQIGSGPYNWLAGVIKESYPAAAIVPNTVIAGTDSRFLALVTNDIYRFAPYKIVGEDMARIHGIDEKISETNFVRTIQTYYKLLQTGGMLE